MTARTWHVGKRWMRELVADYGAAIAVVIITALSYWVTEPDGVSWEIPTRIACKQIYDSDVTGTWSTTSKLGDVPSSQVAVALIPALIITVLFFFDHNVSSQLAQVDDFGLEKPCAYHYDFLLQGLNTLLLGLLGLPPTNGVLPQAPMHTRSLMGVGTNRKREPEKATIVLEQRVSNLIQSLLVGVCMFASPLIKLMPRAVLWGYFIFMAIESFPGNQFIHRLTLVFMDLKSLRKGETLPAYVEFVPRSDTMKFTLMQFLALGCVVAKLIFRFRFRFRILAFASPTTRSTTSSNLITQRPIPTVRFIQVRLRRDVGGRVRDRVPHPHHGARAAEAVRDTEAVPREQSAISGHRGGRRGGDRGGQRGRGDGRVAASGVWRLRAAEARDSGGWRRRRRRSLREEEQQGVSARAR